MSSHPEPMPDDQRLTSVVAGRHAPLGRVTRAAALRARASSALCPHRGAPACLHLHQVGGQLHVVPTRIKTAASIKR
eukprot:CAMPEP_0197919764 /NCGR_PEP_ID=MMETSP1439-20131203/87754_1 /TAXON_ID=66791 /ORGANISM="Gonyaulax spinifera, Strain CCMP409" /LENGTH=76 /DNA_ID=CAMNT_0043541937 /DNA_START=23 /DNA_END=251 /DNA_ORIENTATION=+